MNKLFKLIIREASKYLSGYGICKYYPFRVLLTFLLSNINVKNNEPIANIQGFKMFLDPDDHYNLSLFGVYEPRVTRVFKKEVKCGDVIIDIGSCIGYYTLLAARLVGAYGEVYSFEPNPANFSLIKKSVGINKFKNVVLLCKAVSSNVRKTKLYLSGKYSGSNSIYKFNGEQCQFVDVETICLDNYFPKDKKINFIKIDVEGAEYEAILGMQKLIRKNHNIKIITEFNPIALRRGGSNHWNI